MAIDSTLFMAEIPAATYAAGDVIPLAIIRGPTVVRDGYGPAKLKRLFCISSSGIVGHVTFKNSNWVDECANIAPQQSAVALATGSNGIQNGHDCPLIPNSGWEVNFVVDIGTTTSGGNNVFALIDIDYPTVQAIANPDIAQGTPATSSRQDTITVTAQGSSNLTWTTLNVDILKAGYKYLMSSIAFRTAATVNIGFICLSGAAAQGGLERIIPCIPSSSGNLRYPLGYSTPIVKGPFNIGYAGIGTAGTTTAILEIDWVKK